jgi:hypothetical protein
MPSVPLIKRASELLEAVLRIRIHMDPHDFGLLDPRLEYPHSKCGFQMRMLIRDKLRKN